MPHRRLLRVLWVVAAVAAPLDAGTLVLRDGGAVATRGAWRVEAGRVLFELPHGSLASLRLGEVDLDRSEVEKPVAVPPAPAERGPRRPALRLTDADVAHVGRLRSSGGGASGGPRLVAVSPSAVRVAVLSEATLPGGATLHGLVANHDDVPYRDVVVEVSCERDGVALATKTVQVTEALVPSARVPFAVQLPVVSFDRWHLVVYAATAP